WGWAGFEWDGGGGGEGWVRRSEEFGQADETQSRCKGTDDREFSGPVWSDDRDGRRWRGRCRTRNGCILHRDPSLTNMLKPTSHILLQTTFQQYSDGFRYRGWQSIPIGFAPQDRCEQIRNRFAFKRLLARQQLKYNTTERPDITSTIDLSPARLFRTHVGCGSENYSLDARACRH